MQSHPTVHINHDPLLRPTRRADNLSSLRYHANPLPLLPRVEVAVRHTLELLICSTIGAYCAYRCYAVMPEAIIEQSME
jgi:hypothetical protein